MKKSVFRFLITVATVAVVGFTVVGCNNESGGITITGIPEEFNGMWASAYGDLQGEPLTGVQSGNWETEGTTFPQITDGKASIPMWSVVTGKRWNGNDTLDLLVYIIPIRVYRGGPEPQLLETLWFEAVEFKGGKATVKYTDKQ